MKINFNKNFIPSPNKPVCDQERRGEDEGRKIRLLRLLFFAAFVCQRERWSLLLLSEDVSLSQKAKVIYERR